MSNLEESLVPLEAAIAILGDEHSSSSGEQQRDYAARVRASRVLKRYQSGFTPNLLPHAGLMAFDAIFASKVILKLLYLSLAEDARCSAGEERSAYQQAENDAISSKTRVAQSSGQLLYQLGGVSLLETIIQDWIPELDQSSLRSAWQTYLG
ncbi:MAG: hypothetical protein AAF329_09445 [Cyanobacteria bacterium P01_A01_bin.17]